MTDFPMKVTKQTLEHQGGTKSYHLVFIRNNDGKAILIKRWGKKGAFGQMDVVGDTALGSNFDQIRRDKQRRGYEMESDKEFKVDDLAELKKLLTPRIYTSMGADMLLHIMPGVDTTGVKAPEKIEWVENPDGSRRPAEKPIIKIEETVANQIAANSKWGIF